MQPERLRGTEAATELNPSPQIYERERLTNQAAE